MTAQGDSQQTFSSRRDFLRSASTLVFAGAAARSLWAGQNGKTAQRNIVMVLATIIAMTLWDL